MIVPVQMVEPIPLTTTGTVVCDMALDWARKCRWLGHHQRPGRTTNGKIKDQIRGDRGLPDLILAGHGLVVFAECKSRYEKLRDDQQRWQVALKAAEPGILYFVWRAIDWPDIVRFLANPHTHPWVTDVTPRFPG